MTYVIKSTNFAWTPREGSKIDAAMLTTSLCVNTTCFAVYNDYFLHQRQRFLNVMAWSVQMESKSIKVSQTDEDILDNLP